MSHVQSYLCVCLLHVCNGRAVSVACCCWVVLATALRYAPPPPPPLPPSHMWHLRTAQSTMTCLWGTMRTTWTGERRRRREGERRRRELMSCRGQINKKALLSPQHLGINAPNLGGSPDLWQPPHKGPPSSSGSLLSLLSPDCRLRHGHQVCAGPGSESSAGVDVHVCMYIRIIYRCLSKGMIYHITKDFRRVIISRIVSTYCRFL